MPDVRDDHHYPGRRGHDGEHPGLADASDIWPAGVLQRERFEAGAGSDDHEVQLELRRRTTGSGATTSHTFTTTGTYTVVLTITDDAGHSETTSLTISVTDGS